MPVTKHLISYSGGETVFFDIHSHILPEIDDGAQSFEESIELLELMQKQGITHVMATPHFYPQEDNLTDFSEKISIAFANLEDEVIKRNLPKIYLGCEMLYFQGIGQSNSLPVLCISGSRYLLLELTDHCISETLFQELREIKNNHNIIPIIAHVERYHKAKNYKKFLKFISEEKILTQINASSVLMPAFKRTIKKLLKENLVQFIATDTHSLNERPPMLAPALKLISDLYGVEYSHRFIKNSIAFYKKIILRGEK